MKLTVYNSQASIEKILDLRHCMKHSDSLK